METPNPERHVYASSSVDKHHPDRKVFGEDDETVRTMLYRIVAVRDELDPEAQGLRPRKPRR